MSSKVYEIFKQVELKANMLAEHWRSFFAEISQQLPETYQPEMNELSSKLQKAIHKLVDELCNPTLIIATTGTTSSGKSTLVNFLCGEEIVPVAVEEMSAGTVTIEYSEEKSLVINKTPGALWEHGEWKNIKEADIYARLEGTMRKFIDNREQHKDLACPQSVIRYPVRFLKDAKLELPPGTKVKILDLPGLTYVGDEGNASIIKKCREALCIVTYNSAEVDAKRIEALLQEVVEQVKDLGGSPARMLFVLNRIDEFRSNHNWQESETRFVENTIGGIKKELTEQLKEYTQEIENLKAVKLSTWPALLALQIQNSDNTDSSNKACTMARRHFYYLIEEILEELPGGIQKWSDHDRRRVAKELWQQSYGELFQESLIDRITEHFPLLVIPQVIDDFKVTAGNALQEWAVQTTTAILNSSEENYQRECLNIARIRSSIKDFLEHSNTNLRKPLENLEAMIREESEGKGAEGVARELERAIEKFNEFEPYKDLKNKLYPLYGWDIEIGRVINEVLEAIAESLESRKVILDSPNINKANFEDVTLLSFCLTRLIRYGYTDSVAKEGKIIEAKTTEEKENLQHLNQELNELAVHLNRVMKRILDKVIEQQQQRIYEAVAALFNCHLSYIETGTRSLAPNISINLEKLDINKIDKNLVYRFHFNSEFAITEGIWDEEVRVAIIKRGWKTLWLTKTTYYETEYESRKSDNAEIPSIIQLLDGWINQAKKSRSEIVKEILYWLVEQINDLEKNVERMQNTMLDRYQAKLDKAKQEITLENEKVKTVWQPLQQKAQELEGEFSSFVKLLKKEA